MVKPTFEQQQIIDETNSCVVIARPGSGKTFTLAEKIKKILNSLPGYRGVIAISFTNKASDELKDRTIKNSMDKKGSFFGTIDKFCISEIVLPFLRYKYGTSREQVEVVTIEESTLEDSLKEEIGRQIKNGQALDMQFIHNRYLAGEVYLEMVGQLAISLFDELANLRRYLKSKYSHIIIDEYQDSGSDQHKLFERLQSLGLIAIAVGDLDQSIYAFAGKSSKYLLSLTNLPHFKKYSLTRNMRCHPSISTYSIKLFNSEIATEVTEEKRVYLKQINGSEIEIAKWIDQNIDNVKKKFNVESLSEIAILVRSNRTSSIVAKYITHPIHLFEETTLDRLGSPWARFFVDCLHVIYEPRLSFVDVVEKHFDIEENRRLANKIITILINIKKHVSQGNEIVEQISNLKKCAKLILPTYENFEATEALDEVCANLEFLKSYKPAPENSIRLMTLHKSKGLEFAVVFHLDLYQWIIPNYAAITERNPEEMIQSLNLHYVGITRAKDACILCTSTKRHRNDREILDAQPSEFLHRSGLSQLRISLG